MGGGGHRTGTFAQWHLWLRLPLPSLKPSHLLLHTHLRAPRPHREEGARKKYALRSQAFPHHRSPPQPPVSALSSPTAFLNSGAPPLCSRGGHHAHCGAQKRKVRSGQGLPGRAPGWVRGLIICLPRPAGPGTPEPGVGGCRPGQKPAPVCSHPRGQGSCGWRPAPQRGWGRPDRGRPGASPPQGREGSPPALPGALETGRRPGRRAAPTRSAARLLPPAAAPSPPGSAQPPRRAPCTPRQARAAQRLRIRARRRPPLPGRERARPARAPALPTLRAPLRAAQRPPPAPQPRGPRGLRSPAGRRPRTRLWVHTGLGDPAGRPLRLQLQRRAAPAHRVSQGGPRASA